MLARSVQRCKPRANPHDRSDMPNHLPASLTQHVLNNFSKKSPPVPRNSRRRFDSSTKTRIGEDLRTPIGSRSRWAHRSAVRDGSLSTLLGKGNGPPALSRSEILRYRAGTPNQHRLTNRLYRRTRIDAAQRELSRRNGERFLAPGYDSVPHAEWLRRFGATVLPRGAHFWCKGDDDLWWLGKISASTTTGGVYLVRF